MARFTQGSPYDPTKDYIVITVANEGRRPRTIEKVGLTHRTPEKSQHLLAVDSLFMGARELTEGQAARYAIAQGKLRREDIEDV